MITTKVSNNRLGFSSSFPPILYERLRLDMIYCRAYNNAIQKKYENHHVKLAIVGDFSGYISKTLQDFIRKSNEGKRFFFVDTVEDAVEKMIHRQSNKFRENG